MAFPLFPLSPDIGDAPVPKHGETSFYKHIPSLPPPCGRFHHLPAVGVLGAINTLERDHTCHDPYRIAYLRAHIEQMRKAVEEDGVELMGYTPWGCIDLVSFTTGELKKRYGFIYVDKNDDGTGTGKRYKKDSFAWFQNVIKTNGREV